MSNKVPGSFCRSAAAGFWLLLNLAHADCPTRYEVSAGKVIYIHGEKREGVVRSDAETFAQMAPVRECSENLYGRDKYFVYLNGKIIKGAVPEEFFVESADDRYTHDQAHAYWQGKKISQAIGKGFRAVAPDYARDINRGFYRDLAIPQVDPAHFTAAGGGFVRDDARVYNQTEAFPLAEFHVFGAYARLGNRIFYHQAVVPGASAETFEALGDCFARDKNTAYIGASRWPEVKVNTLGVLEPKSQFNEACTTARGEICCARQNQNLLALVHDKSGALRTLTLQPNAVQTLPGGILKTKTWTFKNLIEQP